MKNASCFALICVTSLLTPASLFADSFPAASVPVQGKMGFGTQCAYGYTSDETPVTLELSGGPVSLPSLVLEEQPSALMLSADCKRKTLTVRSLDRRINSTWYAYPDGSFEITQDGLGLQFEDDGFGNHSCTARGQLEIVGRIDCFAENRDRATIQMSGVLWIGRDSQSACKFGKDAGLSFAPLKLEQCGQ